MDKYDRPLQLYQPFHLPGTPATANVPVTPLERHLELERQKQHHLAQYLIYRQLALAERELEERPSEASEVSVASSLSLRENEVESGREDKTVAWVSSLDRLHRAAAQVYPVPRAGSGEEEEDLDLELGLDFSSGKNIFPFTQPTANQTSGEEFIQETYTHFYDSSPPLSSTATTTTTTTTTTPPHINGASDPTTTGDSPSASTIRSSFSFPSTTLRTPPSTNPDPHSNVQGIKQGVKADWTDITSYASLFDSDHALAGGGMGGVKSFSHHSHRGQGLAHGQALGQGQGQGLAQGLGCMGLDGAVRVGDEMSMGMGVGLGESDMDMDLQMGMRRPIPINHAPFGFGFAPVYASPFSHPPAQVHAQVHAQAQAQAQAYTQPTHTFLPLYPPGVPDSLYPTNGHNGHNALAEFSVSPRPPVLLGKQPMFNGKVLPAYAGMGAFVRGPGEGGLEPAALAGTGTGTGTGTEPGMGMGMGMGTGWGLENYHRGMARENADMFVQLMLNGSGENVSNVSNVPTTTSIVPPIKREDASTAPTTGTGTAKGETDELDSPSDDGMGEDERDVDENVRAALDGHDHHRSTDSRRPPSTSTSTSTGPVRNKPSSEHVHSRRTSGPYTRPEGGRCKSHSFGSQSRSVSASASETPKRIVLDQEGNPSVVRNPLGGGRGYVPGETPDDPKKRHKCEVCGRGFARLYNLKSHAATHDPTRTKPFPCPHDACPRSFSRLHDLERHRQGIHGDGPLVDAKLQGIAPAVARAQERITAREVAYNGSTAKPAVPPLVAPSNGRAHTGDT